MRNGAATTMIADATAAMESHRFEDARTSSHPKPSTHAPFREVAANTADASGDNNHDASVSVDGSQRWAEFAHSLATLNWLVGRWVAERERSPSTSERIHPNRTTSSLRSPRRT